ncbi:MAG: carboxypeptidase regulatory-like domain-containing protein [Bryobacterales bacterium]|nr:carboxypeptidase regulatory-like domain-containing protein [Bryobacterales bacterium]
MKHLSLSLLLAASLAFGQSTQSSLLGTITDATGSPVPSADVTIRNEGTNIARAAQSDTSGDYRVSGLEAGWYRVDVKAAGFRSFAQTRIDLSSAQIKRVDVRLEVGDVTTTVTVEGGTTQVETETATLSNLKTARDFAQLPLSTQGRGWANITNVTAGVQSASGFEVNGARDTANNFTSDGISVNDMVSSRNTANGFSGDIETFAEIKILTANSSAEYPQVAQFAAVSKSGGNDPHGSLYWGIFNSKFSSRAWSDRQPVSFTNHNMFALNGGGPVYIPKLYDGRNKTFFFASYSGARYRIGNRMIFSVPTAAMRGGDFSSLAGRINLVDSLAGGQPFAGNRIPASRISSVAAKVNDLVYPEPNQPGLGAFGMTSNFYADPGGKYDSDVYSFRGDHKISDKNLLFARVGLTINNKNFYPGGLKSGYGQSSNLSNLPGRSIVISDTHSFSSNLVNEAKLGFNRTYTRSFDTMFGEDVQSLLGIQGIDNPNRDPAISGMPGFSFAGALPFHGTAGRNDSYTAQNTYQAIDNFSWYRGRHNFKMGVDMRRLQVNNQNKPLFLRGQYAFDDRLSGLAYSNFLLGWASSASRGVARPNAYTRSTHMGFYWQDDFKLNSRLTLNYGVRYEYQTPWVEKFDRMFTFDPATGSMVTAGSAIPSDLVPSVVATLPIVPAARAGLPEQSLMKADGNNWNPRIGLAYRPLGDATTVIRAGFGIYTHFWPGLLALNQTGGPWQSQETFILENANSPSIQFPNPFRTTSSFAGIQTISGNSAAFPNERTQQWNLSAGRQVWGMALDIGYVGTRSINVPYNEDLNLLRPSTQPFSAARRPYPRFNAANLIQTGGSSIYHGFTIQADRRVAKGVWYNINYTYAKGLTDVDLRNYSGGSQQNQYERWLERSDDSNLRRQQLRFSYVIDLPYGRGQKFGTGIPTSLNHLIGGWQLSGITTMMTGARLSPAFTNSDPANTNQFGGRPDRIGDGNFDSGEMRERIKTARPVFDAASFVRPLTGRGFYGNSARFILTGPGSVNWNAGLHKNWRIRESGVFQFRWEMFNAFNRANFNSPALNISGGDFGLVTTAQGGRSMLFGLRLDY